jgi:hypothetical protein
MSESVLVPIDEDLGPRVLKLRLEGLTEAQIGRELMIATHQVQQALDGILRRLMPSESLLTIDTVVADHMKAISDPCECIDCYSRRLASAALCLG